MNFFLLIFYLILKQKNGNLERYIGDYSDAGCKWTGHYDILQMDKASRIVFVGQISNNSGTRFESSHLVKIYVFFVKSSSRPQSNLELVPS